MSNKVLNGLGSATFRITDNTQLICFRNVSPKATVKATIKRNGQQDSIVIPTMTLGQLIEGQQKMRKLKAQDDTVKNLVFADADVGGQEIVGVYPSACYHFCLDGEFVQSDTDEIVLELKNLQNVEDSEVYTIQGKKVGVNVPIYKKHTMQHSRDSQDLNFGSNRILLVEPDAIPEEIVLYFAGNESRVITPSILEDINVENFGLSRIDIAFNGDITHNFGYKEVLVLDLLGVQKVVFNDELLTDDYHVYTV